GALVVSPPAAPRAGRPRRQPHAEVVVTRLISDLRFRLGAGIAALAVVGAGGALLAPPGPQRHDTAGTQKVLVGRAALGCPTLASARGTATSVDAVAPVLPEDTPVVGGKKNAVELRKADAAGAR